MEDYVARKEYEERIARIDDENTRQNKRIDRLEQIVESINTLTVSVEKLAVSMASMQKELEKQGQRLEAIEDEPADHWRSLIKTVITVVVSALVTYALTHGI